MLTGSGRLTKSSGKEGKWRVNICTLEREAEQSKMDSNNYHSGQEKEEKGWSRRTDHTLSGEERRVKRRKELGMPKEGWEGKKRLG